MAPPWCGAGALEEAAELYRETSGARKNTLRRGQPGTDPSEGWAVAGHSVVLNTTGPLQNNDAVRVTVTSVNPNATHWIAAYSPARANVRCGKEEEEEGRERANEY